MCHEGCKQVVFVFGQSVVKYGLKLRSWFHLVIGSFISNFEIFFLEQSVFDRA